MIVRVLSKTVKGEEALREEAKLSFSRRAANKLLGVSVNIMQEDGGVVLVIDMPRVAFSEHMVSAYEGFVNEELLKRGVKLNKDYEVKIG